MSKQISSNLVLSAIDVITRRKNRPNLERIIRYLYRVHHVSWETSFSLLKKLESEGKVIQVQYKGGYSYRNALSWRRYRSYRQNRLMESWTSISNALSEILALEPSYFGSGVPAEVLEKCVLEKGVLNKTSFEDLLKKEMEKQTLIKLENGHYFLGPQAASNGEDMPEFDPENDIEEIEESDIEDDSQSIESSSTKTTDSPPKDRGRKRKLQEIVESDNEKEEEPEQEKDTKDEKKADTKGDTHKEEPLGLKRSARVVRKRFKYEPSDYYFPALKKKKRGDPAAREKPAPKKPRQIKKKTPIKPPPPPPQTPSKQSSGSRSTTPIGSPRRSQSSAEKSEPEEGIKGFHICAICNFSGQKENDKIFPCSSCCNKGHESCAIKKGWSTDSEWFCPDCKVENTSQEGDTNLCVTCEVGSKKGKLITCDLCGECYHLNCHSPKLKVPPNDKWRCSRCPEVSTLAQIQASILGPECVDAKVNIEDNSGEPEKPVTAIQETNEKPTEDDKSVKEETLIKPKEEKIESDVDQKPSDHLADDPLAEYPIDPSIPDPSTWSSAQVYEYFKQHFQQDVAAAFKEQDIDGQSLLLMQRSDVIHGLGFKLGVGLRVLYHVKKLQVRRSDYKLLWTM